MVKLRIFIFLVCCCFFLILVGCTNKEYKLSMNAAQTFKEEKNYLEAEKSLNEALDNKPEDKEAKIALEEVKKLKREQQKSVIDTYYRSIKEGNVEAAYSTLSKDTKERISYEDFSTWESLIKETSPLIDYQIKDSDTSDVFLAVVNEKNYADDKTNTYTSEKKVIWEDNEWKLIRDDLEVKSAISDYYCILGYMYQSGKGKDQSFQEAATLYNQALKYNSKNPDAYFGLGVVYSELERYQESIDAYEKQLKFETDNLSKSYAKSNLALNYLYSTKHFNKNKAIQLINEALKLNPDNEYAKSILADINSY